MRRLDGCRWSFAHFRAGSILNASLLAGSLDTCCKGSCLHARLAGLRKAKACSAKAPRFLEKCTSPYDSVANLFLCILLTSATLTMPPGGLAYVNQANWYCEWIRVRLTPCAPPKVTVILLLMQGQAHLRGRFPSSLLYNHHTLWPLNPSTRLRSLSPQQQRPSVSPPLHRWPPCAQRLPEYQAR